MGVRNGSQNNLLHLTPLPGHFLLREDGPSFKVIKLLSYSRRTAADLPWSNLFSTPHSALGTPH